MTSGFSSGVVIGTRDPARMAAFYGDAFGFDAATTTRLDLPGTDSADALAADHGANRLFFVGVADADTSWQDRRVCDSGFSHLALRVHDFDAALDRAVDAGYRPGTTYRAETSAAVYGQDPEGNTVELCTGAMPSGWDEPADPSVAGVVHVGVATPDIQRLADWYVEHLGFTVASLRTDQPVKGRATGLTDPTFYTGMVTDPRFAVELFEWLHPTPRPSTTSATDEVPGSGLIGAVIATDDLDARAHDLARHGIAVTQRSDDQSPVLWTRDCDGNRVGFTQG